MNPISRNFHYLSEEAFTTWADCLACQPNPKQMDINVILDRRNIPKSIQDRDIKIWPRDPGECRARLQAMVDRELPRLKALEATLRTLYEEPERAEAEDMALVSIASEEMSLLRAERVHEQSYLRAATALLKVRKETAGLRPPAGAREIAETALIVHPAPRPAPGSPTAEFPREGRSRYHDPVRHKLGKPGGAHGRPLVL